MLFFRVFLSCVVDAIFFLCNNGIYEIESLHFHIRIHRASADTAPEASGDLRPDESSF